MSVIFPASQDRGKADWTPSRDAYLVDLLLEQQHIGKQSATGWTKEAWKFVVHAFNLKFDVRFNKQQLKSRFFLLKKQYRIMKALREQNGFRWDDILHTVTAADDVWDRYLLTHPEAKPFRRVALPLYDKLGLLFEPDGSNGEGKSKFSIVFRMPREGANTVETLRSPAFSTTNTPTLEEDIEDSESTSTEKEIQVEDCRRKRCGAPSASTTSRRERRIRTGAGYRIAEALQNLVSTSELLAKPMQASTSEKFSYETCLTELQEIEGLDDFEFVKAVEILKDDKNAIAFMSLKGPRRLIWLKSVCRAD